MSDKTLPPARVRTRRVTAPANREFQERGLRWLKATAAYEKLDDPIMTDAEWDALTKELWENYDKLDPYLRNAIPEGSLSASTGSGVDWTKGLPLLALNELKQAKATAK